MRYLFTLVVENMLPTQQINNLLSLAGRLSGQTARDNFFSTMSKGCTRKLEYFIGTTHGFASFTMQGNYDLRSDLFFYFFDHYIKTGENILNDYHTVRLVIMQAKEGLCQQDSDLDTDSIERALQNDYVVRLFSDQDIDLVNMEIVSDKQRKEYRSTKEFIRYQASLYTNKWCIRKIVFDRDGKICVRCFSDENLTLDHIIPVSKGGQNTTDNLQVLCKSCNSKKGNR